MIRSGPLSEVGSGVFGDAAGSVVDKFKNIDNDTKFRLLVELEKFPQLWSQDGGKGTGEHPILSKATMWFLATKPTIRILEVDSAKKLFKNIINIIKYRVEKGVKDGILTKPNIIYKQSLEAFYVRYRYELWDFVEFLTKDRIARILEVKAGEIGVLNLDDTPATTASPSHSILRGPESIHQGLNASRQLFDSNQQQQETPGNCQLHDYRNAGPLIHRELERFAYAQQLSLNANYYGAAGGQQQHAYYGMPIHQLPPPGAYGTPNSMGAGGMMHGHHPGWMHTPLPHQFHTQQHEPVAMYNNGVMFLPGEGQEQVPQNCPYDLSHMHSSYEREHNHGLDRFQHCTLQEVKMEMENAERTQQSSSNLNPLKLYEEDPSTPIEEIAQKCGLPLDETKTRIEYLREFQKWVEMASRTQPDCLNTLFPQFEMMCILTNHLVLDKNENINEVEESLDKMFNRIAPN